MRASALRSQIEQSLAERIPSALTPAHRSLRPVAPTGIAALDRLLHGGLPLGAITELVGPECSGRTSLALSFLAQIASEAKVCAWIDVSNSLHPESAAATGIDLTRLLWVRCGVPAHTKHQPSLPSNFTLPGKYLVPPPTTKGLHGGGCGAHPRAETKGLSNAIDGLLRPELIAPRCAEPQPKARTQPETFTPTPFPQSARQVLCANRKPWSRIDQALRVTDLLLKAGGFSAIVLDMGGIAPEVISRIPLATWFRYRAAAERTQASILLLTQHACAKSSAGLVLRMAAGAPLQTHATVFTGMEHTLEIARERFAPTPSNVIPLRKPPQSEKHTTWHSRTAWAGGL
jgi:recombination protein RecA